MKKIVLTALNAKYFHTNLAVRYLKKYVGESYNIDILEHTINDNMDVVLESIVSQSPDAVGFSCYIWNIEKALTLAGNLKKVLPNCFIFLGGPEVSFECTELMEKYSFIDMIIKGEGEIVFSEWINAFENDGKYSNIQSIAYKDDGVIKESPNVIKRLELDTIPFLYDDLSEHKNKIIYFETSRGCPMKCAYCMSGLYSELLYLSLENTAIAFEHFIKNDVKQVKLVDRTFNYPLPRAKKIIEILINIKNKYPESKTNFHFEITASMIDDEFLEMMKKAPSGLIQFEAGVQSTNPDTLKAITRNVNSDTLLTNIKKITDIKSVTVYVDLIAGLPYESYNSFKKSFNDVYSLNADKIHLGFLKVLKGSEIKRKSKDFGIIYCDNAPYKVLKTRDISFNELNKLSKVEHIIDLYYNSGNFISSCELVTKSFETPFDFYEGFVLYLEGIDFFAKNHSIIKYFDVIFDFVKLKAAYIVEDFKDCLLYDWSMMEKPKRYPEAIEPKNLKKQNDTARIFFSNKENVQKYLPEYIDMSSKIISRLCHIIFFDNKTAVLFDYKKAKKHRAIKLEKEKFDI